VVIQFREIGMTVKGLCVAKGIISSYTVQGIGSAWEETCLRLSLVELQFREVGMTGKKFVLLRNHEWLYT
jgi:hypothetical protein